MPEEKYTPAQLDVVRDLVETYGIDHTEIKFFADDPQTPFIGYDASCVMLDKLMPDLVEIDVDFEKAQLQDSIQIKVRLTDARGRKRAGVGIVNRNEKDAEGNPLTDQQLHYTALARALRSALRAAGIDLIKLHRNRSNIAEFSGVADVRAEAERLRREVHALGSEVGFIDGTDKTHWRRFLTNRYKVASSSHLGVEQLADLASALKALRPVRSAAA